MVITEQWLTFICALRTLSASGRPLRICGDFYFPTECDMGTLPVLPSRGSVLHGAVLSDGGPAADVFRVWLEIDPVSGSGQAKAERIRRSALWRVFQVEA